MCVMLFPTPSQSCPYSYLEKHWIGPLSTRLAPDHILRHAMYLMVLWVTTTCKLQPNSTVHLCVYAHASLSLQMVPLVSAVQFCCLYPLQQAGHPKSSSVNEAASVIVGLVKLEHRLKEVSLGGGGETTWNRN